MFLCNRCRNVPILSPAVIEGDEAGNAVKKENWKQILIADGRFLLLPHLVKPLFNCYECLVAKFFPCSCIVSDKFQTQCINKPFV